MKKGNNIIKQLGLFMTAVDQNELSKLLSDSFENIHFIDTARSNDKSIKELTTLAETTVAATILNAAVFSIVEYRQLVDTQDTPPYSFPMVGKGMIQYIPSAVAKYDDKCLKDGYLGVSYNVNDSETEAFVKKVFKMVGEKGKKVFLTARNKDLVADTAEKNIVAWPDAVNEYSGVNGKYLTQTKERYLIAK